MKDINGKTLDQPYYDLAVMRREQQMGSEWVKRAQETFDETQSVNYAFLWEPTPEKHLFWHKVHSDNHPTIPQSSLAELDAWRRERGFEKREAPAHDWKAKYEAEKQKAEYYEKQYNVLKDAVITPTAELQSTADPSNFISECAMRAMQGMLSNPSFMDEQDGYYTLKHEHTVASLAFDYAQAMAAEGRKRGHLPNN